MRRPTRHGRAVLVSLSLFAAASVGSCEREPAERAEDGASASFETQDTVPSALLSIPVEPVRGRTGPGGDTFYVALRTPDGAAYLHRRIGRDTFALALRVREPDLTQYPCASCHAGQDVVPGGERDEEAVHRNIRPVHPEETGADCATCHAREDVSRLRLEIGGTAALDHAYRLCARCHAPQVDSWAMGAHGKRLVGWRGRRVVMGCADCHSPHDPATEKRIPYPGPRIPRGGEARP